MQPIRHFVWVAAILARESGVFNQNQPENNKLHDCGKSTTALAPLVEQGVVRNDMEPLAVDSTPTVPNIDLLPLEPELWHGVA